MFLWYNSKIVLKIPLNLVAAAVVNAKQCVLKLFTSPGVCVHCLLMLQETEL